MAFRRSFARRAPFRRFRRRGGSFRAAATPGGMQYANFYAGVVVSVPSTAAPGNTTNTVLELIKMFEHLGDPNEVDGNVLASVARSIDVHSMVFSIEVLSRGFTDDVTAWANVFPYVCTADLDGDGNPTNALPDFFQNQTPIINVGSVIAAADTLESRFPVRFHYRNHYMLPIGFNNSVSPIEQADDKTTFQLGVRRLRIKRRFREREGLYIGAGIQQSSTESRDFTLIVSGGIWYKVAFGR